MTRFLAVLALLLCSGCGPAVTRQTAPETLVPTRPAPTPASTVEYKLATIQANTLPGELLVNQFHHELAKLSATCNQSEITLSDKTVVAHNILFKQGVNAAYLDILRDINSIVDGLPAPNCDDVIAAYVTLRAR